jgi:hypothetical protein
MGNGVESKNGRQRVVDIVLELAQLLEQLGPLAREPGDLAGRDRQQRGFQDRAQKRKPDGDQGKDNQQQHHHSSM